MKARMFNPLEYIFGKLVVPKLLFGKLIDPKTEIKVDITKKNEDKECKVYKDIQVDKSDSSEEDLCFVDLQEATGSKR